MPLPAHHIELNEDEADAVNQINYLVERLLEKIDELDHGGYNDPRALALSRTHVETAGMWATKAIAKGAAKRAQTEI